MQILDREKFLQLPAAHDALTARLIQRAGFPAYQVGGFALVGTRYGHPDVDLQHFGEKSRAVHDIIDGNSLPVLVDCDEGYGDAKNITRIVRSYEAMRVSAVFIEDQTIPKRCGHMAGKTVIPTEDMVSKVRAVAMMASVPSAIRKLGCTALNLQARGVRVQDRGRETGLS